MVALKVCQWCHQQNKKTTEQNVDNKWSKKQNASRQPFSQEEFECGPARMQLKQRNNALCCRLDVGLVSTVVIQETVKYQYSNMHN